MGDGFTPHGRGVQLSLECIARSVHTANFFQGRKVGVNPIFVSKDQEEDPRVEAFRQALHSHYDGVVMSTELPPRKELPERGAYGYAYIPLIPDAVPQRQKSFPLKGERLEAHKKSPKTGLTTGSLRGPKWF